MPEGGKDVHVGVVYNGGGQAGITENSSLYL